MQHGSAQEHPQHIEMSLRDHLLAAGAPNQGPPPYPPASGNHHEHPPYPPTGAPHQGHDHPYHHPAPNSASPHDPHLDPNVAGGQLPYGMSEDNQGEDGLSPDARNKGKRELSTSKRAAQNRAAQRAFRQRKEGYIKKLEEQVKEFQTMEQNYKALQNENYQLREYILNLQSRLLESQSDIPPAPSHINLTTNGPPAAANAGTDSYGPEQQLRRELAPQQAGPPPPAQVMAREDPIRNDGIAQLQAAAQQGIDSRAHQASPYGLGNDYKRGRPDENMSSGTEIKAAN